MGRPRGRKSVFQLCLCEGLIAKHIENPTQQQANNLVFKWATKLSRYYSKGNLNSQEVCEKLLTTSNY